MNPTKLAQIREAIGNLLDYATEHPTSDKMDSDWHIDVEMKAIALLSPLLDAEPEAPKDVPQAVRQALIDARADLRLAIGGSNSWEEFMGAVEDVTENLNEAIDLFNKPPPLVCLSPEGELRTTT